MVGDYLGAEILENAVLLARTKLVFLLIIESLKSQRYPVWVIGSVLLNARGAFANSTWIECKARSRVCHPGVLPW